MLRVLPIVFFSLILFSSALYSQECKGFITGEFEPDVQLDSDSIFYIITLSDIFEIHSTRGYRNLYSIKWLGPCRFELNFKSSSGDTQAQNKAKQLSSGRVVSINDSLIQLILNEEPTQLKRHSGGNLWKIMVNSDKELKEILDRAEMLMKEYKAKAGSNDSIKMDPMLQLLNSELNKILSEGETINELEKTAVVELFNTLRSHQADNFYPLCSGKLKENITKNGLQHFFDHLQLVFGKWETFSVWSQGVSTPLTGMKLSDTRISKFGFKIKFENYNNEVQVALKLSNDSSSDTIKLIYSLIFYSDEEKFPTYLEELAGDFFQNLNKKKYSKIYNNSSRVFKDKVSQKELESLLYLAHNKGNKYKLNKHTFSLDAESGGVVNLYFVAEGSDKNSILRLVYTLAESEAKLAGVHLQNHP